MAVCYREKESAATEERSCRSAPRVRRICFVCTGNTCRSPMAEAVARAMAKNRSADCTLEVSSAGLYANEGERISAHAVEALELAGVDADTGKDYRQHRAHTITAEEAERADWLVGMSGSHCTELLMRFPSSAQRIVMMPTPISDPYGGDLARYRHCLEEITEGITRLLFAAEGEEGTK